MFHVSLACTPHLTLVLRVPEELASTNLWIDTDADADLVTQLSHGAT